MDETTKQDANANGVTIPPVKLSEEDRLKLALLTERGQRLDAEKANLNMVARQLQAEQAKCQLEQQALSADFKTKYHLAPGDSLDVGDGSIKRAPVRAVEEVKAAS
jgi:hypothetical protein